MTSKLQIKIGTVELSYEGETVFDIASIKDIISHIRQGLVADAAAGLASEKSTSGDGAEESAKPPPGLHTNSIASKLTAQTGPDVAMAAAAHLQIVLGKAAFSRQELSKDMQSATTYYKMNMSGNLTKIINTLVTSGKFNQVGQNSYSLSAMERSAVEKKIA